MYYTSNERDYSSLPNGIFISENKHESKNTYTEMYFFDLIFQSSTSQRIMSMEV